MNHENFITASDGIKLYRAENKVANPAAQLLIVHGMGDHLGRYDHVVRRLNGISVNVTRFDHRGHGHSQGPRVYCPDFRRIVDDVEMIADRMLHADATTPLYLYGHSMGGLAVSLWACRHPGVAAGLILASPMTTAGFRFSELLPLPGAPETYHVPSCKKPQTESVTADPLLEVGVTVGLLNSIHASAGWLEDNYARIVDPVLLIQGQKDLWVPEAESLKFYASIASADKGIVVYPGMRHNLLQEEDREKVLDDIVFWLEKRRDAVAHSQPAGAKTA